MGALNQLLRRDQADANSRKRPRKNHTFRKRKYKNNETKLQRASNEFVKESSVIKLERQKRPIADQAAVFGVIRTRSMKSGQRRKGSRLRLETTIQKPSFSHVVQEARNNNNIEVSYKNADMVEQKGSLDGMTYRKTESKKIHEKENTERKIEKKMFFLGAEASVKDLSKNGAEPAQDVKPEDVAEVGKEKYSIIITDLKPFV